MKLKYVLYMAAALSLTGCNDSFLERGPQNLNDQSFWVSVDDLKAYANAFYGLIPGGVSVLDDTDSDIQVPNNINSFLWGQYVVPTEGGVWQKSSWQNIRNINYFMTHYQSGCQHLCSRNAFLPCAGIFQQDSAFRRCALAGS